MLSPVQCAFGTCPDTMPRACTIIDLPVTDLLILTFQLAFAVEPAGISPRETFIDPELRAAPSGKVIIATAFLAGYRDELKGEGHGYVISAVTVAVEPDVSDPEVLM